MIMKGNSVWALSNSCTTRSPVLSRQFVIICLITRHLEWRKSRVLDLEHGLAKVVAVQDANEALAGIVDTDGRVDLGLHAAISQPLANILLVLLAVLGPKVRVEDDEALEGKTLGDHGGEGLDAVALRNGGAVLRNLNESLAQPGLLPPSGQKK